MTINQWCVHSGVSSSTFTAINILHQKYQPPVLEEKQAFAVLQKASVYTYTQNSVHFLKNTNFENNIQKSSTETSLDNWNGCYLSGSVKKGCELLLNLCWKLCVFSPEKNTQNSDSWKTIFGSHSQKWKADILNQSCLVSELSSIHYYVLMLPKALQTNNFFLKKANGSHFICLYLVYWHYLKNVCFLNVPFILHWLTQNILLRNGQAKEF